MIGRIKHYEMHESGKVSPIPYNVEWVASGEASKLLGWFFIYQSNDSIEVI